MPRPDPARPRPDSSGAHVPGSSSAPGSTAGRAPGSPPAGGAEGLATAEEIRETPEFADLRNSFRRFIFPMAALFLAWYALYVLLAALAPDFMAQRVGGSTITVGLLLGLGQFVSTFVITMVYRSWADRTFDPQATALRERIEGVA